MLMLPFPYEGKLKLLIVLEDDNVQRIKEHDCAEINWAHLGQFANLRPSTITIGYANPAEMKQIQQWAQTGNIRDCIKLVTEGFKFRPEMGDHDHGPVSLRKKAD
jgi:hypothetical protein